MAGLVGAALAVPAPVSACPQGARCIALRASPSELASALPRAELAAPAREISLVMRSTDVPVDRYASLRDSLSSYEPEVTHPEDVEVPWIWSALAGQARSRLPRSDNRDFSLVVSPVVVSMPTESSPGLGVSGKF